jgi:acetylornithine/succinyldiaminopimelate/putrescine aminotransferase
MDSKSKELVDNFVALRREQALTYLPGVADADLFPMGRGSGAFIIDEYGGSYLDFGSGGAMLLLGHRDSSLSNALKAQAANAAYRGAYGDYLDSTVGQYAQRLAEFFPLDRDSKPRQTLVVSSEYEARMVAAQLCVRSDNSNGALFLSLLSPDGVPLDGGEVQDQVHQAKAAGLKVVVDEVGTGFGRTGTFCYHEQFGLTPDVVILGPEGGGGIPFSAVVAPRDLFAGPAFTNLQAVVRVTTMASPMACAAGQTILDLMSSSTLLETVARLGEVFSAELETLRQQFDHVLSATPGVGLLRTILLRSPSRAQTFRNLCRSAGLIISPTLRLTPPLTVTEQQVRTAVDAIAAACIDMGAEQ